MSGHPESEPCAVAGSVFQSWHEWELEDGARKIILCIRTGLELRPGYPDFDRSKLEDLMAEATDMMRISPSPIDALRIVPFRSGN